ncbi:MAG TPA: carboxypeptidase regulatory-like domain-containing protein [Bryobacteraceae bacterium]
MRSKLLALLATVLLCSLALLAQVGTEGSFFGTVTDATGATVPNAEVIVTNLGTQFSRTVTTGQDGNFDILSLPIGSYSISVSAKGFKKWELTQTALNVGDRDRISPVLQVGQLSETVSVSTTSEVLQTETAATQTVVQMQQIRELPLANRNPLTLVALVPGMRWDRTQTGAERATYVQGQGLRDNKTAFQLDGLNSNAPSDEGGTAIPNVDTIAEFNVETGNFSAESGRDPIQVRMVTKSGTNELHGDVWEYVQNDIFNARKTFAVTKNRVRYNQFGTDIGGPIIHNKTFFFGSFQGTTISNARVYNSLAVTPAMKTGDFSAFSKVIKNPFNNGAAFPGNKIPASMIDPASKYFLPLFLEPNSPDGFFRANASSSDNTWEGTLRIDHQITDAQRIYGRYVNVREPRTVLGYNPVPSITGSDEIKQQNIGLNYTWTMSANTVITASAGTLRTNETYANQNLGKQNDVQLAGIQGFPTAGREAWIGPPDITFNGGNGYTGISFPGGYGVPGSIWGNSYNAKVGVNRIAGNHTMAFGFEYGDWRALASHGSAAPRGVFNFGNLYSNDGFADYLLGLPSSSMRNDPLKDFGIDRAPYTALYFNDSWRVRQNLTLTLGLRYDRYLAHHNVNDVGSTWSPELNKMVVATSSSGQPNLNAYPVTPFLASVTKDLWTTARAADYPDGLYEANGNWAPRLGAVYRPFSGKDFVIRGGYGIFYNSFSGNRGASMLNVPHWALESRTLSTTTLQPWETFWPNDPTQFGPFQVYAPLYNVKPARTHEWNISVQSALPFKSALTVSYVGTRVDGDFAAKQYNDASIGFHGANLQADRPHPAFSGIQIYQNLGHGWYNALQTKLERRFSAGITYSFAYSFSRSMADSLPDCETCGLLSFSPDWYNRGRTSFDYRHIQYATMVWELPVGRGKKYLSGMNRFSDAVIGGWQLSFTEQARSGQPLSIGGGTPNLGNGAGTRADIVGDPHLANPSATQWFNTAAFAVPNLYTFGSSGMGIVEAPGVFYVSTSLAKNFHITERKYLQLRGDVFNIQNRANLAAPNTTKTDGNFGRITDSGDPRFMQLSMKFVF